MATILGAAIEEQGTTRWHGHRKQLGLAALFLLSTAGSLCKRRQVSIRAARALSRAMTLCHLLWGPFSPPNLCWAQSQTAPCYPALEWPIPPPPIHPCKGILRSEGGRSNRPRGPLVK
eukprot:2719006-Alexandrium_andersonii.AAC.2